MARKKTPDQLYEEAQIKREIREEYGQWLRARAKENTPHNAHVFVEEVSAGGDEYKGMKKRDLILFLAGSLPYMYD